MSATEPNGWTLMAPPTRGRSCGGCQACCTMIPVELVPDMIKPAGTRCVHQCSHGCAIYDERPTPCAVWSCRWLFDPDTAAMKRPDKSGYVIDCVPDTVFADGKPRSAVQVWVDPNRREAYRDPALRAYLALLAERFGYMAIVRFSEGDSIGLFAPALTGGDWHEVTDKPLTQEEMDRRMAAMGESPERRFLPR